VEDLGIGAFGEFKGADDKIFVTVSFENMSNASAVLVSDIDENLAISTGVDNSGLSGISNYVGEVRNAFGANFLKEHKKSSDMFKLKSEKCYDVED
jgi:hypothetical protein